MTAGFINAFQAYVTDRPRSQNGGTPEEAVATTMRPPEEAGKLDTSAATGSFQRKK